LREVLRPLEKAGEYRSVKFESIKLRLAHNTFYTPDFSVVNDATGELELHEVKGYWEEDARVKIKVAAHQYPEYRFLAIQHKSGKWITEEFAPA